MYGNTTPVKFIFCVKKIQEKKYIFRPYDLEKIKEKGATKDYFVITPSGITHVYNPDTTVKEVTIDISIINYFSS